MPYVHKIEQNTIDSHQTSSGYVLTFLRWSNRDTFNYDGDPLGVRKPLVVINDAIQLTVSNTKKGMTSNFQAVLKGGDIHYATAVAPGDIVLVNMLNWEEDVVRVAAKAANLKPINKFNDGFKGMFRIQSVVENINTSDSGMKTVSYNITANGFTEFSNVIYYNPAIVAAFREQGTDLYSTAIGEYYNSKLKTNSNCQDIVPDLFRILIGKSYKDSSTKVKDYGNNHFKVPQSLGSLLGRDAKYMSDVFNYVVGVWGRNSSTNTTPAQGFNPNFTQGEGPNFFETGKPIQGNKLIYVENWNNSSAWSILKNNINSVMNEMYTTYRIDNNGYVIPTVVVRQKPFTTPHFKAPTDFPITRFFDLPRWDVSSNLIKNAQLGRHDAARFNFTQVFTRALADTQDQDMAQQIAEGNFQYDEGDISRYGLRPYVVTSNFDFPVKDQGKDEGKKLRAKPWSEIVNDWVVNGHLKTSGTIKTVGLQEPISVGDNIQFNNSVLHLESVVHTFSIGANGRKIFRTNLSVSYGMRLESNTTRPVYDNMEHTDAHTKNIEDWGNERLRPGISDTQMSLGRLNTEGEELKETRQASFTLNSKPDDPTKKENTGEVSKPSDDSGEKN